MLKLDFKYYVALNEMFRRLNNLRRWTSLTSEERYNELNKLALNGIVTVFLAAICVRDGIKVDWNKFPKLMIYRAFQKVYVYFDTPEYIIDEICKLVGIPKEDFLLATQRIISDKTDDDFSDFLCGECETEEMQIYRAATKIATYLELIENPALCQSEEGKKKEQEIYEELAQFPYKGVQELIDLEGNYSKLLRKISRMRNQNRWSAFTQLVSCSILGHLFDTAVLAYFMGIEKYPDDEETVTKLFFLGLFHDIPEAWTKDIPSPIKDYIKNFRTATEEYEDFVMDENVYSKLPKFLVKIIKSFMFERPENRKYRKFMKGADYLSADLECARQYYAGTNDKYYLGAMIRTDIKLQKGDIEMSELGARLHRYLTKYAMKIVGVDFEDLDPEEDEEMNKILKDLKQCEGSLRIKLKS